MLRRHENGTGSRILKKRCQIESGAPGERRNTSDLSILTGVGRERRGRAGGGAKSRSSIPRGGGLDDLAGVSCRGRWVGSRHREQDFSKET